METPGVNGEAGPSNPRRFRMSKELSRALSKEKPKGLS